METKIIINPENPNGLVVECTAEEISQRETDAQKILAEQQAKETAKAQKEADALAGNNKLLALGLSQAEVTAMTGYKPE